MMVKDEKGSWKIIMGLVALKKEMDEYKCIFPQNL